ncbi:MAG TPA: sensor histidine kinase [Gelria sp.]|nr:sensor histidine kinase [Gelria sp.]
MIIALPQVLNSYSLPNFIDNQFFKLAPNELERIMFDFSKVRFATPIGLIATVAMMKYCKFNNVAKEYYLREGKSPICSYLERMDFYKHFSIQKPRGQRADKENSMLEIQAIDGTVPNHIITKRLLGIIEKQVSLSEGMYASIGWAIGETIDNIEHHSQSKINGYVCAQTYDDSLEIGIVDCGIGIREALWSNDIYKNIISHDEAIKVATGKKVTGKPGQESGHSGIGLFVTKSILQHNQGTLLIISGDSLVQFGASGVKVTEVGYWQGTLVGLQFNLKMPVNLSKDILQSEFPEDNDLDKMF